MCRRAWRTFSRVRLDLERRGDRVRARRLQRPLALDFHDADAADARDAQVRVVAQRRNPHPELLRRLEHRRAERHLHVLAVDGDRDQAADRAGGVLRGGDRFAPLAHRRARRVEVLSGVSAHRIPRNTRQNRSPAGATGGTPVLRPLRQARRLSYATKLRPMISSLKCLTIDTNALGLDCPSPHLDASCIVSLSASSSCR